MLLNLFVFLLLSFSLFFADCLYYRELGWVGGGWYLS